MLAFIIFIDIKIVFCLEEQIEEGVLLEFFFEFFKIVFFNLMGGVMPVFSLFNFSIFIGT